MSSDLVGVEEWVEYQLIDGLSLEEIRQKGSFIGNQSLLAKAIENKSKLMDDIIHIQIPPSIVEKQPQKWYTGPKESDIFWPKYKKYLKEQKEYSDDIIKSLHDATEKILTNLENPSRKQFKKKGLVVGYVQSGKTANYTGVIAKAADRGYKMFILLTSSNKKLRKQTQVRIESDLIQLNTSLWHPLTSIENDFGRRITNSDAYLSQGTDSRGRKIQDDHRTICIVKKNTSRLSNLINWVENATPEILDITPILIIDDEADQASINVGTREKRTTINRKIIELINKLKKVAYIGYTATPFACVLIEPNYEEDLYPRDFILDLPKPKNYFGAEKIFGRERLRHDDPDEEIDLGLDVIREVPEDEISDLKPSSRVTTDIFAPKITNSLKRAIRYFWLATAARYYRGQSQKHSTMLIHTTSYATPQNKFLNPLIDFREISFLSIMNPLTKEKELDVLRDIWEFEQNKVDSLLLDPPIEPVSFEQLGPHLKDIIKNCDIFIENSTVNVKDRMAYGENPGVFIVVGGNILSRGLTLEGLVVSYFIRGASAYDTLLQMGRWFGFRIGYDDLPRIWMTNELRGYFYDMAGVEEEIRYDIQKFMKENVTPLEFGVRIRTHPHLLITSRLKMKHGIQCNISYSEKRVQTIIFKKKNKTWLRGNLNAVQNLFKSINANPRQGIYFNRSCWGIENVDVHFILDFLDDYTFHENSLNLDNELLKKYIIDENQFNSLLKWNVVIMSRNFKVGLGKIDLGFPNGEEVNLINRSEAIPVGQSDTNLKSIMLREDTLLDFYNVDGIDLKKDSLFKIRTREKHETGLIIIYPISKDSIAREIKLGKKRPMNPNQDLKAVYHILGVGLVFPKSKITRPEKYLVANVPGPSDLELENESDKMLEEIDDE